MNEPLGLESLSADDLASIDECCEGFEEAWKNGIQPSLESSLRDFESPTREFLLRELVEIELHYRSQAAGRKIRLSQILHEHPRIVDELSTLYLNNDATVTSVQKETHTRTGAERRPESNQHSITRFNELPAFFGRYKVLKQLGQGGMGSVYLAQDMQLGRDVALKLPRIDRDSDPQVIARFYREARAAATLNHPNLCSVYDVGEIDGVHYLTMEYIEGDTLAHRMTSQQIWDEQEAVTLIHQLSLALEVIHQKGIVHRDLKPANIMLRHDGTPIVTDFGLAQVSTSDERTQITQHGQILGSPSYMSPEQVDRDLAPIGSASDVYSLGVILYELLTGERPYQGSTAAVFTKIVIGDAVPIHDLRQDVDRDLEAICQKMMERIIDDRFSSMQAVTEATEQWLQSERHRLPDASKTEGRHASQRKWQLLCGGMVAVMLLMGAIFLIRMPQGKFRVSVNDDRVRVLVDGQHLELTEGLWEGNRKVGVYELALKVGEHTLPLGATTSILFDSKQQLVRTEISGIELTGNKFQIMQGVEHAAAIEVEWLPVEKNLPTAEELSSPQNPAAYEREVADWAISYGGAVRYKRLDGPERFVEKVADLPEQPFTLTDIEYRWDRNPPTSLKRLNGLQTLDDFVLTHCQSHPDIFKGVRFHPGFSTLNIMHSGVPTSALKFTDGLDNLTKLTIAGAQIDDQLQFLKSMPNLRELEIVNPNDDLFVTLKNNPRVLSPNLRILKLLNPRIDSDVVTKIQAANSNLTVIKSSDTHSEYLGIPVQKRAIDELIEAGVVFRVARRGESKHIEYSQKHRPTDDHGPPRILRVELPAGLHVTSEIISTIDKLSRFFGFKAPRATNADALADLPPLAHCDGLTFTDSDLTDVGFEKLCRVNPHTYFNIINTAVTQDAFESMTTRYPCLQVDAGFGKHLRNLKQF